MNSIANVVETKFGQYGEPQHHFKCPVVVAPSAQAILQRSRSKVDSTITQAATAADLIGQFGDCSESVDFAYIEGLDSGTLPIAMRAEVVEAEMGNVVRIQLQRPFRG